MVRSTILKLAPYRSELAGILAGLLVGLPLAFVFFAYLVTAIT